MYFSNYAKSFGTLQSDLLAFCEAQKKLDKTSTQELSVDNCGKKMRRAMTTIYTGEAE